jgi:spermidine/putrescine transport system permease protein
MNARRGSIGRAPGLTRPLLIWVGVFVLAPLVLVVAYSLTREQGLSLGTGGWSGENYQRVVVDVPVYRLVVWRSFTTGFWATLITLAISYLPAVYLAQCSKRVQRRLILLLIVPFWTPYIIRIFTWLLVLSDNGVLASAQRAIGLDVLDGLLFSRWAVLAGLVYSGIPFVLLPIYASVSRIDPNLYEAASNLGAKPWAIFRQVTFPLSLPGVWVGSVIAFILATGSYLAPAILGGPNETMVAQVILDRFLLNLTWPLGSAVSISYLVASLLLVGVTHKLFTRHPAFKLQAGTGRA